MLKQMFVPKGFTLSISCGALGGGGDKICWEDYIFVQNSIQVGDNIFYKNLDQLLKHT